METNKIKQRKAFVDSYASGLWSMSVLCEHFNVSRPTGYLWVSRFNPDDLTSLYDRSSAPGLHGNQADPEMIERILWARGKYGWGAKKLRWRLCRDHPDLRLPARSAINAILDRNGLLNKRRARRRWLHPGAAPLQTDHPNQVWPIDFKGHFKTRDGVYCYPLTVTDHYSRSLLACQASPSVKTVGVTFASELFCEIGLPEAIRSDNGAPLVDRPR